MTTTLKGCSALGSRRKGSSEKRDFSEIWWREAAGASLGDVE